jgi:hypothetical protein
VGPPLAPKRSNSLIASKAALAIPIELALSSGKP